MGQKIKSLKGKIIEYIKFNIVGTINFIVSQIAYIFLHLAFHLNYIIAYTIISILSVIASYYFNSKYTFKDPHYSTSKLVLTIFIYIFEFALNLAIIVFLVKVCHLGTIISPLLAPVLSTPVAFLMMRKVVKKPST